MYSHFWVLSVDYTSDIVSSNEVDSTTASSARDPNSNVSCRLLLLPN